MMGLKTKICKECGMRLPLSEFRSRDIKPGRCSDSCLVCNSAPYKRVEELKIGGLTFVQHADSVRDQKHADAQGLPKPPTQFAFWGRKKLDEVSVKARVSYLQSKGYIQSIDFSPPLKLIPQFRYANC